MRAPDLRARRWRLAWTLGALFAVVPVVHGGRSQTQPTFETQVNYVVVPVRVLDARGEFVRGLTAPDFRVREDGKPQEVATFTAVDLPVGAPVSLPALDVSPALDAQGRVYALVVDDLFMSADEIPKARSHLKQFITRNMSADDLTALVRASAPAAPTFTRDRDLLVESLEQMTGTFDPHADQAAVAVYRDRVRAVVAETARSLGSVRDRRKTVLVVSSAFDCLLVRDMTGRIPEDGHRVTCGDIFDAAVRAGVTIYTLDPRGLTTPNCAKAEWPGDTCVGRNMPVRWGVLAEATGGFAITATNNVERFFDRIVQDNSAYYLIGYYSTNSHADGKYRKHDIKVDRRGLRVIHRAGYLAPRRPR